MSWPIIFQTEKPIEKISPIPGHQFLSEKRGESYQ